MRTSPTPSSRGTPSPAGSASRYPSGNEFPTVAFWQAQFIDVAASNFHLIEASPYRASGTDALDLGAAVAQIEGDALAARIGRPGPPPPVAITTTTLPDGQTGVPYAATLAAIGGNGTYAWALIDGALPPGVSLGATTGVLSGTPTHPGRFSITVQAQDATDPANSGIAAVRGDDRVGTACGVAGLAFERRDPRRHRVRARGVRVRSGWHRHARGLLRRTGPLSAARRPSRGRSPGRTSRPAPTS